MAAVHCIPHTPMTLLHRKLQNVLLRHASSHPQDTDGFWSLPLARIRDCIQYNSNNHQHLRGACEALLKIVCDLDVLAGEARNASFDMINVFSRIRHVSGVLRFKLNPDISELLVSPDVWANLDMLTVRSFRSATALALYEFVARYEAIGHTAAVSYPTLFGMLHGGPIEGAYENPKHFLYQRLRPAVSEVNSISPYTVELVRTRSEVHDFVYRFSIRRKPAPSSTPAASLHASDATARLIDSGLTKKNATRLVLQHGPDLCLAALQVLKQRLSDPAASPIRNPGAFLFTIISNGSVEAPALSAQPSNAEPSANRVTLDSVRESFLSSRRARALSHLRDLPQDTQAQYLAEYHAVCSPALRVSTPPRRASVVAFSLWLAQRLWGEPTSDQLIVHAASMASVRS